MNETENADLKSEISRLNQIITVLLKQNDMLEKENSYLKTGAATSGLSFSNPKTEVGKTENTVDLPALIPAEGVNVSILSQKLKRAGFLTVNRDGLRTASILLLHFYNKGKGDYPTLRKLTGLSEGGLAKAIMALKKRGLIHRTAYREFGLSAAALEVVRAAFAK